MAGFSSHELMPAPDGTWDVWKDLAEYKASWRCYTDQPLDGPQKAIAYAQTHLGQVGSTYAVGNDSRPGCWLRTWEAHRDAKSLEYWILTATYKDEAAGDESSKDAGGNPTDNPMDFRPEVEVQTVQYTRPCESAEYIEGFLATGRSHAMVNDQKRRPICNSALSIFDPPPERDDSRWSIRIKRNMVGIDCDSVPTNCVNSAAVVFNYRGVKKTVPKYCGKLRDFQASPRTHSKYGDYVEVTMMFDVYDTADGSWRFKILDRGFSARAMLLDPDGHGGTIYDNSAAFVEEAAPQRRLNDADGLPLSEPVLLNGDGQPLHTFKDPAAPKESIYAIWKDYDEKDWNTWPILADVID